MALADRYASAVGTQNLIRVFAQDASGNTTARDVDISPLFATAGEPVEEPSAGCAVAEDRSSTGGWLLALMAVVALGRRRRRSPRGCTALAVLLVAGLVGLAACGSDSESAPPCVMDTDCADACPAGDIPVCSGNECICASDVPLGEVGRFSEIGVDEGMAWSRRPAGDHCATCSYFECLTTASRAAFTRAVPSMPCLSM